MIDLLYSNTFMAAQGKEALYILEQAVTIYRDKLVLVVEAATACESASSADRLVI